MKTCLPSFKLGRRFKRNFVRAVTLLIMPILAGCQGYFQENAPAVNDISLYMLGQIFGNVGDVLTGGSSLLMQNVFTVYTAAALTIATIYLVYAGSKGLLAGAENGSAMGMENKRKGYLLMRAFLGYSSLLPVGSGGYPLIVVLAMYVVRGGVVMADQVYDSLLDHIDSSSAAVASSSTSTDPVGDMDDITQINITSSVTYSTTSGSGIPGAARGFSNLTQALFCARTMYWADTDVYNSSQSSGLTAVAKPYEGDYQYFWGAECGNDANGRPYGDNVFCFGSTNTSINSDNTPTSCGLFMVNPSNDDNMMIYSQTAVNGALLYLQTEANQTFDPAYEAEKNCQTSDDVNSCESDYYAEVCNSNAATDSSVSCAMASTWATQGNTYYETVKPSRQQCAEDSTTSSSSSSTWIEDAQDQGWASAGLYYQNLMEEAAGTSGNDPSSPTQLYCPLVTGSDSQHYFLPLTLVLVPDSTTPLGGNIDKALDKTYTNLTNTSLNGYLGTVASVTTAMINDAYGEDNSNGQSSSSVLGSPEYALQVTLGEMTSKLLSFVLWYINPNGTYTGSDWATDWFNDAVATLGGGFVPGNSLFDQIPGALSDSGSVPNTLLTYYNPSVSTYFYLLTILSAETGLRLFDSSASTYNNPDLTSLSSTDFGSKMINLGPLCGNEDMQNACKYNLIQDSAADGQSLDSLYFNCYNTALQQSCYVPGYGLLGMTESLFVEDGTTTQISANQYINYVGKTMFNGSISFANAVVEQVNSSIFNMSMFYAGLCIFLLLVFFVLASGLAVAGTGPIFAVVISMFLFPMSKGLVLMYAVGVMNIILLVPIYLTIAFSFLVQGIMLVAFIQYAPVLIFTFGVIAWAFMVIEFMLAMVLVALAFMHPDGDDVSGKAEPVIAMAIALLVRPAAMILALGVVISFSYVIVNYVGLVILQLGIGFAVNIVMLMTSTGDWQQWGDYGNSPFYTVGYFVIYSLQWVMTTMLTAVMMRIYSLLGHIPDRIAVYLGGYYEGDDIVRPVQNVRSSFRAFEAMSMRGFSSMGDISPVDLSGMQKPPELDNDKMNTSKGKVNVSDET